MIGQLVLVGAAWREVLGEDLSASLDGDDQALGAPIVPKMLDQKIDNLDPGRRGFTFCRRRRRRSPRRKHRRRRHK